MTDQEIRDKLTPEAISLLLHRDLKEGESLSNGCDLLAKLGLWDEHGCPSDQCYRIVEDMKREELREQ